jgi:hypothetical protein
LERNTSPIIFLNFYSQISGTYFSQNCIWIGISIQDSGLVILLEITEKNQV